MYTLLGRTETALQRGAIAAVASCEQGSDEGPRVRFAAPHLELEAAHSADVVACCGPTVRQRLSGTAAVTSP
jgi:hypothetical protein